MKRTLFTLVVMLTLVSTLYLSNTFAQDNTEVDETDKPQLLRTLAGHTGAVYSVAYNPDGQTLASGSSDGTIRLWDAETGRLLRTLTGHAPWVLSVSFSSDGQTLASGGGDTVRLWDVKTGRHFQTIQDPFGVSSVSFRPGSQTLATYGSDNTVRLWDANTGRLLRTFTGGGVLSMSFSSDGQTLAGGSPFGPVYLWDANTGRLLWTLEGTGWVSSVSFSPDGNTLASGSDDKTIRLWDVNTGHLLRTLEGHIYGVSSVSFSPDGNTLASGSGQEVRIWNASTGGHLGTLGHTNSVSSVSFSPDGQTLASGSWDGTVLLWKISPAPTTRTTVSISPTTITSPDVGEQFTISLNIAEGKNIAGYQATVEFDTSALRYVESANGDYLPAGAFFIPPIIEGNTVIIGGTSLAGENSGGGTLATLTFEVVAAKASTVNLSNVLLTDSAGGSSTPQVEGAEITEPPQLPEDINRDGVVNIIDLTFVASNFGKTGQNDADVNGDGIVNIVDLTLVAGAFGNTAAAPKIWDINLNSLTTRAQVEQWLQEARQINTADPTFQHGIRVLEQLLATLTPKATVLLPNYPNPFNPETWIPYQLATPADVSISIYAVDGTVVRTLSLGHQPIGMYHQRSRAAYWDGKNTSGEPVASGVYFYTLTAGDFTATRKMLIRK